MINHRVKTFSFAAIAAAMAAALLADRGLAAEGPAAEGLAAPAEPPAPRACDLLAFQGDWRGELAYRDYGTGAREVIAMAARARATPDNGFLVTEARYVDPGFDVFIMTVAAIDEETGALMESHHRANAIEKFAYGFKSAERTGDGWVCVFEDEGVDDGRPAMIRRIFSLDGDVYTQRKEIDFLDDMGPNFIFRNETVLRRSAEPVTFDDFTQRDPENQ